MHNKTDETLKIKYQEYNSIYEQKKILKVK